EPSEAAVSLGRTSEVRAIVEELEAMAAASYAPRRTRSTELRRANASESAKLTLLQMRLAVASPEQSSSWRSCDHDVHFACSMAMVRQRRWAARVSGQRVCTTQSADP